MTELLGRVAALYARAPFIAALGIRPESASPGVVTAMLPVRPDHLQQDGFIHAGVQATLADHTAGAAGFTSVGSDETVLTVEFKLNLLRPATGTVLRARAEVLRAGQRLVVVESSVFGGPADMPVLVAKATGRGLGNSRGKKGAALEASLFRCCKLQHGRGKRTLRLLFLWSTHL